MDGKDAPKVVRVTDMEFELSDGRVFEHPEPLDEVPSVEEFDETYQYWSRMLRDEFGQTAQDK